MIAAVALAACGSNPAVRYDYSQEPDPRKTDFVIGVSDHLAIKIWKNPDLSSDVIVRPDGTITMPLIGELPAAGLTPKQLRDEVTQQLANYVKDEGAVVTVAVTAVNSYSYTVAGNVEHAGTFRSDKYVTVIEAISQAGGPNKYASPSQLKLIRVDRDGKTRLIPIDYEGLMKGRRTEANLALMPGDQLYMP